MCQGEGGKVDISSRDTQMRQRGRKSAEQVVRIAEVMEMKEFGREGVDRRCSVRC